MIKWLFGNFPYDGAAAKTILVDQTRENLSIAEKFDPDIRRRMSRDFFMTQLVIEQEMQPKEKISKLTELVMFWTSSRQDAIRRGADSEEDDEWNNAACIEAWTMAELCFRKGQLSEQHCKTIGEWMRKFIQNNLSSDEQREVRAIHSKQTAR